MFHNSRVPNKSKISCLVNLFCDTGSVHDKKHYERTLVLSGNYLDDICQTLLRSPQKLLRKLSLYSELS